MVETKNAVSSQNSGIPESVWNQRREGNSTKISNINLGTSVSSHQNVLGEVSLQYEMVPTFT